MALARVLVVVRDLGHRGVRARMLELEPRHEHPAAAVGGERERDRTLGRDEVEAGVVVDVVRLEEHGAGEAALLQRRCECVAARGELLVGDLHAAGTSSRGASARSRLTRSSTFGCVTKSAARPSSMNGLNVQSGSVAGEASNATSSDA